MVFVQKWPFFLLFFLSNIGQENVFYNILEHKIAFLGYKNKKFKKSKNSHFSKGVNQCFWSKNGHFSKIFFFQAIKARKMYFTIFQNEKSPFQAVKTTSSKSRKIGIVSQGSPILLVQKWPLFQFFLKTIYARKMSFTIFQNGKSPFQAIKQELQKVEKFTFFQKG